jgi:hypothetical protein
MESFSENGIPNWLKWFFITINRVGFPIVAFLLMWKMCNDAIAKVNESVEQNTIVLMEVRDALVRVAK